MYSGSAIHRFDDVCRMLGMAQHAPNGWKKLHVKPHVICVACFSSWAVQCAIGAVLFAAGVPWLSPVVHPCYMVATTCNSTCLVWIWRGGPQAAKLPAFRIVFAGYVAASVGMLVAPFVKPEYTPFSHPYMAILGAGMFVWSGALAAGFGGNAADHPQQPHNSLWAPISATAFSTMRIVDIITDIGFVRILMTQVSPPLTLAVVCNFRALHKQWPQSEQLLYIISIHGVLHNAMQQDSLFSPSHSIEFAVPRLTSPWSRQQQQAGIAKAIVCQPPVTSPMATGNRTIKHERGGSLVLPVQVPPCTWYGEPVPCLHFTRLGALAALVAAVNIVLTFAVTLLGGQTALTGGGGKQCDSTRHAPILTRTTKSTHPAHARNPCGHLYGSMS